MCILRMNKPFFPKEISWVILLLLLTSCGVANRQMALNSDIQASGHVDVINTLYQAHEEWQGTPYVLGGSGSGGIDCSAFTQTVYRDYFGETLPRNTREQLQEGSSVRRNYIRPGDLIFFRTGRGLLHVGVALEEGKFLHASVSSGVMISRLNQRYWATRYLASRRIF